MLYEHTKQSKQSNVFWMCFPHKFNTDMGNLHPVPISLLSNMRCIIVHGTFNTKSHASALAQSTETALQNHLND